MTASIDTYRSVSRDTMSPRAAVLKVTETARKELAAAEAALAAGKSAEEPLGRAQTLVGGLMSALDFTAGDLATHLLGLYLFVSERIQEARAAGKDTGLGAASRVLGTLADAWREIPADALREDGRAAKASGLHVRG